MESLWNALDDYLAAQLLAAMGSAGSYTTLIIAETEASALIDVQDWPKEFTTPFQIVESVDSISTLAGHDGGNTVKRAVDYSVRILSVCDGTRVVATRNAKTLIWRTEKLLATLNFATVRANDGSALRGRPRGENRIFSSGVKLFPHPSNSRPGLYHGVDVTDFSITRMTV